MTVSTDRIEKQIVLHAPRSRVWRALSDAQEFGEWFGMAMEGPFTPGTTVRARITTPGYEHLSAEFFIERVEPETLLSYRWHPYAIDPEHDYSQEPTTLVEFHLADVAEGVELTVIESGFDQVPLERRAEAFRMNEGGWTAQIENIAKYVSS